jgi:hypothetical protein
MEAVWTELQKRRRKGRISTNDFLHSVSPPGRLGREQSAAHQNTAIAILFKSAVHCARLGVSKSAPESLEFTRSLDREKAAQLRKDALLFSKWEAKKLIAAALIYEKRANGFFLFGHGDKAAMGFAIHIAKLMCDLFGSPKYGTVATLVSVGLHCEIELTAVREWCRGVWGKRFNISSRTPYHKAPFDHKPSR